MNEDQTKRDTEEFAKRAIAEFAKGLLTYVVDGNVVEINECGFVDELRAAIVAGGMSVYDDAEDN